MGNSEFLKEMGITEWVSRDQPAQVLAPANQESSSAYERSAAAVNVEKASQGNWLFFGSQPAGDAQVLFQNIVRALGLSSHEWSWKNLADPLKEGIATICSLLECEKDVISFEENLFGYCQFRESIWSTCRWQY